MFGPLIWILVAVGSWFDIIPTPVMHHLPDMVMVIEAAVENFRAIGSQLGI